MLWSHWVDCLVIGGIKRFGFFLSTQVCQPHPGEKTTSNAFREATVAVHQSLNGSKYPQNLPKSWWRCDDLGVFPIRTRLD